MNYRSLFSKNGYIVIFLAKYGKKYLEK